MRDVENAKYDLLSFQPEQKDALIQDLIKVLTRIRDSVSISVKKPEDFL